MVSDRRSVEVPRPIRDGVPLVLWGGFGLLLLLRGTSSPIVGASVLAIGILGAMLLRAALRPAGRTLGVVPAVLALGFLSATAAIDPFSELLAGGAGISLLLWVGTGPGPSGSLSAVTGTLFLPALAVLLGVVAGFALPGIAGGYGTAALLLVGVLLVAAWLFARPSELSASDRVTSGTAS